MRILKMRYYPLLALAVLLPLATVAASSGLVFAQQACSLAANAAFPQYSGPVAYGSTNPSSVQMNVPISMTCPYASKTLWAAGTVINAATNTNLGNNSVQMNTNGDYYSGVLRFTLSSSAVGQPLQVSISVYNGNIGQSTSLVTTKTLTIQGAPSYYSNYPYSSGYPYYYSYPSYYPYNYPSYYYGYGYPSYYYGYPYSGSCSNQWYSGYGYGYPYYGCNVPYHYYYYYSTYYYYHHHH